jgi:DNA-binding transcriptional ArsR family regulator
MPFDALSSTFAALSDPTRRAILSRLSRGEASVTDLAAPFDMSLPAVSKHLSVLERSGLIERRREARFRPCKLRPAPLQEATDWIERHRRAWEETFDRLDDYLATLQAKQAAARAPEPVRTPAPARKRKSAKKTKRSR